jgi:hypothetical protein
MTLNKKYSQIDPLHSIRFFMRDNEKLEKENKHLKRMINKEHIATQIMKIQNTINYNLRYNLRYNIRYNIPGSDAQQLIDNAIEQRREIIGYYIASQNN